jgi:hypothetical protein
VLGTLASVYGLAARVTRTRLGAMLAESSHRLIAVCVGAMAVALVLPIPFGNVLPALAVMLIGLGWVFRDGLAVLLGMVTAASTIALMLAVLVVASGWVRDWAVGPAT